MAGFVYAWRDAGVHEDKSSEVKFYNDGKGTGLDVQSSFKQKISCLYGLHISSVINTLGRVISNYRKIWNHAWMHEY